ncbi:murein L,D-transpeptidase [Candidatus Liberibacter sp.]|uniref:L,D-transpeptidase family protein n=1 Tax=Candidatus Liberibacter sp. TaxID=34022 RepID=UPI0015F57E0B|nr:L,D-transpeptidase family protein [Candidatus Liberibacter sp.]MBA5723598.1 L,D-transpeptidase family protein [Candidatus Liberibacter sp.]
MSKWFENKRVLYDSFIHLMFLISFFLRGNPIYSDVPKEALEGSSHAIWDDRFDTSLSRVDVDVGSSIPILSDATLAHIKQSIKTYRGIVDKGGWPLLSITLPLRLGDSGDSVKKLRERLIISGDLSLMEVPSSVFDSYVKSAVEHFQTRHGLPPDGVVEELTLNAMNVSASQRLQQLRINYARIRGDLSKNPDRRYVMVNIPAAYVEAVENGEVVLRSVAIVGKVDRQTPILHSAIRRISFNPYWSVPRSIIKNDIVPIVRKDPMYLTNSNIHLIDNQGKEVRPEDVDWNSPDLPNLIFRQDPGKINAMASAKIEFYSPNNVYMHDTPEPSLFNNTMRFETSGCVRVNNIKDLNVWLLKETPGWSRRKVDKLIESRKNTQIKLSVEVPVHFVYISAWSVKDQVVQFRDDVYGLDGGLHVDSIPLPRVSFKDVSSSH